MKMLTNELLTVYLIYERNVSYIMETMFVNISLYFGCKNLKLMYCDGTKTAQST